MEIKTIESKKVKDRTKEEHLFLLKEKYNFDVRKYLLSMGDFKDYPIPDDVIVTGKGKLAKYALSDKLCLFRDDDRYYLADYTYKDVMYLEFKEMKKLIETAMAIGQKHARKLVKVERDKGIVMKETYSDGTTKKVLVEDPVEYILQNE